MSPTPRRRKAGLMMTTSATLGTVTSSRPLSDRPGSARSLYPRLWRTLPRELGYLVLAYPIALTGFVVSITFLATGFGTLVTFFIGVFILIATLYIARGFGTFEVLRLRWAGRPEITRPEWQDGRARTGFWGWLRAVFGNGHYWLYLVHTLIVNPILSLISWIVTIVWVSVSLATLSYGFWINSVDAGSHETGKYYITNLVLPNVLSGAARTGVEIGLNVLLGLVLIAVLPFVTRGLVVMQWAVGRPLLGPFRSDALQREVIALNASRGAVVAAEGQSLRKLERDLHDGPQQRLVRLQMDIQSAQRQLDDDPAAARDLLDGALLQSKEALEELRSLSRGFAPPLLLDRGLVVALESLADRSTVATTFTNSVPVETVLPQEIERNAYFVASELLVNVAKHAEATTAQLEVSIDERALVVSVTDNGHGGAVSHEGHGLAGLEERLAGLGGTLAVSSPTGGPTIAVARLPITLG